MLTKIKSNMSMEQGSDAEIPIGQHSDTLPQNQPTNQNSKAFLNRKPSEITL